MTEVTEVTSEQPAAAAEGEGKKEGKEEEPKEKPKEEKKKEPKPKVEKPPPDYRTVKAGWIERPGICFSFFFPPSSLYYLHFDCVYRCYFQEL